MKYNNKSNQNRINYLKILERIKKKENNDKFLELVDMNVATFYNSIYLTKNIPSILDYYCPNRETKEKIPMFFTMFIDTLKNKGIMQKTMREDLNLSGSIITRLKHNGAVTTETIGKICEYLQCTPNDIMEIKFDSEVASSYNEKHKGNIEAQIAELQAKLKTM